MVRIVHFVDKSEVRKYKIQDVEFELEVNEKVFPPSAHGSFFGDNLRIVPGETVIDIGTGTGILAILAAKMGGIVSGTDSEVEAIELAKKNAHRNSLNIDFRVGEYFGSFDQKFDYIIANLPQDILHQNYQEAIGDKLSRTLHGGSEGNEFVLEFLDRAKKHMHEKSRVFLGVNSATYYAKTLEKIAKDYNAKMTLFTSGPTKVFVEDNIEFYKKLHDDGKIHIFKEGEKWMGEIYLFELTLK